MDNYVDEKDYKLLEIDKYTFFVLRRIIDGPCKLLLSDHKRLIICFSTEPFPTWIWTADDATEEEMEKAYRLLFENNLMNKEHTFYLKYELSDYFINRALKDGINLSVKTNMFAYDCPNPIKPDEIAEGEICRCEMNDKEERSFGRICKEIMRHLVLTICKVSWQVSDWFLHDLNTEENIMQTILFIRFPRWLKRKDAFRCFTQMRTTPHRMPAMRRLVTFFVGNFVQLDNLTKINFSFSKSLKQRKI